MDFLAIDFNVLNFFAHLHTILVLIEIVFRISWQWFLLHLPAITHHIDRVKEKKMFWL